MQNKQGPLFFVLKIDYLIVITLDIIKPPTTLKFNIEGLPEKRFLIYIYL